MVCEFPGLNAPLHSPSLSYRLTTVLLAKDLRECYDTLNTFFPCVTLECEKHILSALGYRWELEEVTCDNDLFKLSRRALLEYACQGEFT